MQSELPFDPQSLRNAEGNLYKLHDIHRHQSKHLLNPKSRLSQQGSSSAVSQHPLMNPLAVHTDKKSHFSVMRSLWAIFDATYFQPASYEHIDALNRLMQEPSTIDPHEATTTNSGERAQMLREISKVVSEDHLKLKEDDQRWAGKLAASCVSKSSNKIKQTQTNANVSENSQNLRHSGNSNKQRIEVLEEQLSCLTAKNVTSLESIAEKMRAEIESENKVYLNDESQPLEESLNYSYVFENESKVSSSSRTTELESLRNDITKIEKRIVSNSMAKVMRVKRDGEESVWEVCLESAMEKTIFLSQREFDELNKMRELSMLEFYSSGWKSPFNFTCHNYLGFSKIFYRQKHVDELTIRKRLSLSELRLNGELNTDDQSGEAFESLQMCHNCRLLHPKLWMKQCEYSSKKHGYPLPVPALKDNYLTHLIKLERNHPAINAFLHLKAHRNCAYHHYIQTSAEQYCCRRYYCKMCLKNYDQRGIKFKNLCPYCQGKCICPRCISQEELSKLKTLYLLQGGDYKQLEEKSFLRQWLSHEDPVPKFILNKLRVKTFTQKEAVRAFILQAEEIKWMSLMTVNREKNKRQRLVCEQEIFREKLASLEYPTD